jgi:hypothetical protein
MIKPAIIAELEEFYRQVPAFDCRPGCSDCCGPVFFSGLEWHLLKDRRQGLGALCPYAHKGRCAIYCRRPMVCRLFGAVKGQLICPYGHGPALRIDNSHARWLLWQVRRLSAAAGFGTDPAGPFATAAPACFKSLNR